MYICIYLYMYLYVFIYIYIYLYIFFILIIINYNTFFIIFTRLFAFSHLQPGRGVKRGYLNLN